MTRNTKCPWNAMSKHGIGINMNLQSVNRILNIMYDFPGLDTLSFVFNNIEKKIGEVYKIKHDMFIYLYWMSR